MAQVTKTVAQGILDGQGYTDNEVRQLAYHFLAAQQPAPVQEPFDFDAAFDAVNWDEWRHKPVRELVRELHRVTTPVRDPAPPADVPMLTDAEWTGVLGFTEWTTDPTRVALMNIARAAEKAVRQKAGLQ